MSESRHRAAPALLTAIAAAAAILAVAGSVGLLLSVAPILLLLAPLVTGRYLGEERLHRLRAMAAGRTRRAAASISARRLAPKHTARGGLLIARSLSGRAPPTIAHP